MSNIQIKNNRILYYGNTAGYLSGENAVVDPMFQTDELKSYLTEKKGLEVEWTPGTFERLATGTLDPEGNTALLRRCRVWQIAPETDVMMKFINYDDFTRRFGEPDPASYQVVYDGEVDTNDLEALYTKFNVDHPPGYEGHSLSMSDVLELYDKSGSTFHYCDTFGFKEISFQAPEQEQIEGLQMNL
ncbi:MULTISPECIES: YodL domain-containing protein [Clostridia]|uniref:YodL domain-containing protein n=1 Tax=Clostridia TaxID=186801 RepID=UPI0004063A0E|nr:MULTISPECIES: YodL domain-containing protein [Clostridia]